MTRRLVAALALGLALTTAAPTPTVVQVAAPGPSAAPATPRVTEPARDTQSPTQLDASGCATHAEWDQLETVMRPATVADLLGTSGVPRRSTPSYFSRSYDVCWDAAKVGVVRYDQLSALSISWTVKDR